MSHTKTIASGRKRSVLIQPSSLVVQLPTEIHLSIDERKKVEDARAWMPHAELLGMNPLVESPALVAEGLMLYRHLFPNSNEREDERIILQRLGNREIRRNARGCFDVMIGRDAFGRVIAWHQFSTVPLSDGSACCFLQYTGSAGEEFMDTKYGERISYQGRGIFTYSNLLMISIGDKNARETLKCPKGCQGIFLETEFPGQGATAESISYTHQRLAIHQKSGFKALLIEMKNGTLISPHLQPSLGKGKSPIRLLLMYRPQNSSVARDEKEEIPLFHAKMLLEAFIKNFSLEGFESSEVQRCEDMMMRSIECAKKALLVPATEVPDMSIMAKHDPLLRLQTEQH